MDIEDQDGDVSVKPHMRGSMDAVSDEVDLDQTTSWHENEDAISDSSTEGSDDDDDIAVATACATSDIEPCAARCTCNAQGGCPAGRPPIRPFKSGAQVYCSSSTACSRALAEQVKLAALSTKRIHGSSTTGTPWLHARKLSAISEQNEVFLGWCRSWIEEVYGTDREFRAPRTEPHIVKYDHKLHAKFKGIGVHQDGSFVTCIMALSEPTEYSGGGTYFPHLAETVRLGMGEVLIFQGQQGPYSAPHRAQPIASGRRILYIAFFQLRKRKVVRRRGKLKVHAVQ